MLGGLIGAAALLSSPRDASAAFGDAARVRSKVNLSKYQCCCCNSPTEPKSTGVNCHLKRCCMCRSLAARQLTPQGECFVFLILAMLPESLHSTHAHLYNLPGPGLHTTVGQLSPAQVCAILWRGLCSPVAIKVQSLQGEGVPRSDAEVRGPLSMLLAPEHYGGQFFPFLHLPLSMVFNYGDVFVAGMRTTVMRYAPTFDSFCSDQRLLTVYMCGPRSAAGPAKHFQPCLVLYPLYNDIRAS